MDDIWRAFLATLLLVALPLTSASAHRLRAFAFAEGAVIHGYVCFGSNGPAQGAYIRALDPNGALIAETTSDADGRFSIVAQRRVDYRTIRFSSLPLNYSVQIDAQGNVTDAVAVVAIVEVSNHHTRAVAKRCSSAAEGKEDTGGVLPRLHSSP